MKFFRQVNFGVSCAYIAAVTNTVVALKTINGMPRCAAPSDDFFPTTRVWILHAR